MTKYFITPIGRLRFLSFLEGLSLLVLVFIAMPVKYYGNDPGLVKLIGPIHGALFLLFVFGVVKVGIEQQWPFRQTAWVLFIGSFIPFGTFYIDHKILRHL